jgi:succinate dehydrogenase/fumarate reductase flavoprotein subunit
MTNKAGIRRYGDKLEEAAVELEDLNKAISCVNTINIEALEVKNLAECGKMLIEGALNRKKSCGSHQRFDEAGVKV